MSVEELAEQRTAVEDALRDASDEDEREALKVALGELDEMIELQRELDAAKEETAIVAESAEVTAPSRAELPEASPGPDGGDDGQNMPSFATSTASASSPANPARNLQQLASASAEPERNLPAAPGAAASTSWLAEDKVVMAKWEDDGQWYEAKVKALSADGRRVTVIYDGFDTTTELVVTGNIAPISSRGMLQAKDSDEASTGSKQQTGTKRSLEAFEHKERDVPASLRILPTDSADVRDQKRRRIRSIQKGNKAARVDAEHASRASGWQSFAASNSRSGRSAKSSIFRTGTGASARVGVTGSGRGVSALRSFDARSVQRTKRR
jgi:hypothetical protein